MTFLLSRHIFSSTSSSASGALQITEPGFDPMERLLTVQDLADRWRYSVSRIRNTPPEHLPPAVKFPGGRAVRYRLEDVEDFEQRHVMKPLLSSGGLVFRGPGRPRKSKNEIIHLSSAPTKTPVSRKPGRPRKSQSGFVQGSSAPTELSGPPDPDPPRKRKSRKKPTRRPSR